MLILYLVITRIDVVLSVKVVWLAFVTVVWKTKFI